MPDVPEIPRDMEHEPRPPRELPPHKLPYDVPVTEPPFRNGKRASLAEKIALPARQSVAWDAARHFMFGMLQGGGGALAALAAAGMMASPVAWPVIGACAAGFGIIEAGRKVIKAKNGGKDWTDILYQILELILKLVTSRKGGK